LEFSFLYNHQKKEELKINSIKQLLNK